MADERDIDERIDRIRHWAQSQSDMFRDGDVFVLRREGDEVHIDETPLSRLHALHPRLYGRLSSLDAQLDTGCLLYALAFVFPGLLTLGLRLHWWDGWLDAALLDELDAWWFYLALFSGTAYLVNHAYDRIRRRIYRRQRGELFDIIAAEGLERDTLVPLLNGAADLHNVTRQLKLDPGPFPPAAAPPGPRLLDDPPEMRP